MAIEKFRGGPFDSKTDNEILLFSLETSAGVFSISTPPDTFAITLQTYGCKYTLSLDGVALQALSSPFKANDIVAKYDKSAPDTLKKWTCHLDKKFKMQLLGECLDRGGHNSYRSIVDYFEHKHPYLLDRMAIKELLEELAVTGQLDKLPSDSFVPAELRHVAKTIKKWHEADKGGA